MIHGINLPTTLILHKYKYKHNERAMRQCKVFVGSSHPELGQLICSRLGVQPSPCTLKKFSNGETSVQIGVSVRDENIYVVQSSSNNVNDHIMELLILISAFRSGSASKITAVIPHFPYSKQSKMKKHRGAITARMLANLLIMAGADHVISMDLHASQMQGFFSKPVDNLYGGPTLASWIRHNVPDYKNSVVVSKNPGGTKRVTALADSLKVNFAMIHTDRRRTKDNYLFNSYPTTVDLNKAAVAKKAAEAARRASFNATVHEDPEEDGNIVVGDIRTGRIVKGHVVEDTYPTPESSECDPIDIEKEDSENPKMEETAWGGSVDAMSDDEEEAPNQYKEEKLITLVGDVRDKPVIILDDMIVRPSSFVAAAEHCRLNCGAKSVYVVATHGVFSEDCLDELSKSSCIDHIVVTNTYPISHEQREKYKKLTVIDVSAIFAECIRRDHNGESISVLFDNLAMGQFD